MDRFTGPERDAGYLCRPMAAGAEAIRTVDPRLPNNYSNLIAESRAEMIPIKPGNVPRLWPSRYRLLALWGGATFIPEPLVWPPLGSGVASARAV
ncbi:MAG TPA: hypothetical protein VKJ45_27175 [Blastocatellia bacterium]|nr:hypothetical protein [Blastocatellia bacterium]